MGNIKGYVLDSMVADEDLYQFEQTCDYFSYEDILSESGILRPLLQVYRERELNGAEIRITNRNHKKDFFKARGFYVLKESSDIISGLVQEYEKLFAETQKEVLEAISFCQCKDKFSIHRGDFVFYDVNIVDKQEVDWEKYKQQQDRARSKADMYKAQATLNRAASMMLMGPDSAPMSATNTALLGGALAGTTGAIIGAASGLEQQRKHNEFVNSYNSAKNSMLSRAEDLSRKAAEMETLAISGDYPYKTVIGGEFYFGIRTLFGIIPAIHNFGKNVIEVGLRTLSDWDKPVNSSSAISIVEIEDDRVRDKRWKSICDYFEKGILDINTSEAASDVDVLLREMLDSSNYNGVIGKWKHILEIDPHNADALYIMMMVENELSYPEEAIRKEIRIGETRRGQEIMEFGRPELIEKIRIIDCKVDERIELTRELNDIVCHIEEENEEIERIKKEKNPLGEQIAKISEEIDTLEKRKKSLGVFKGKEKRKLDEQIGELENNKNTLCERKKNNEMIYENTKEETIQKLKESINAYNNRKIEIEKRIIMIDKFRLNETADSPCCSDGSVDVESECVVIQSRVSGNVVSIVKNPGDRVWKGDTILTVGAALMSIPQVATHEGLLVSVEVEKGERIEAGKVIAKILEAENADFDTVGIETSVAGQCIRITKETGERVKKGDTFMYIEVMKMEIPQIVTQDGIILVDVEKGDSIKAGQIIARVRKG